MTTTAAGRVPTRDDDPTANLRMRLAAAAQQSHDGGSNAADPPEKAHFFLQGNAMGASGAMGAVMRVGTLFCSDDVVRLLARWDRNAYDMSSLPWTRYGYAAAIELLERFVEQAR